MIYVSLLFRKKITELMITEIKLEARPYRKASITIYREKSSGEVNVRSISPNILRRYTITPLQKPKHCTQERSLPIKGDFTRKKLLTGEKI